MKTKDYIPFTYLIGWSTLNKWYYGVRYAKGCHPDDLWTTYFTSSPIVKNFVIIHGRPDVIQIRRKFTTSLAARLWEDRVHHKMNVVKSDKWLNKNYGNIKFITDGHFCGKDKNNNPIWVSTDDPRVKTGEIRGIVHGTVTTKDKNGLVFQVDVNDPRYISGELVSIMKDTQIAMDKKTGEIVGRFHRDDKIWQQEEFELYSPFTGKVSTNRGLLTLEEYYSSDAKHTNSNNAPAKDSITNKSLGRICKSDPRWKTGEIVGYSKDYAPAKNSITKESLGNIHISDPRWKTGEIIPLATGTAAAKDAITGESIGRISTSDPRWKTGEIVGARKRF